MVVFEDGKPRTGEYRRFRIRTVQGPERLRQPPGGAAPSVPVQQGRARRGARRSAAGRCRTSSSSTAARARSAPPRRSSTSSASTTCRWRVWPRSARSCSCPDRSRPGRPAGDVTGALPRPAAARRGAPVRDHLPPRPARQAGGPLGVRRPARRRTEAQARAAQGLRLDQARPRGAGRADRRGPGHRPRPGGADQGDPRGLSPRAAVAGVVPCNIPPRCAEPDPSSSSSSASSPSSSTSSPGSGCPTPRAPTGERTDRDQAGPRPVRRPPRRVPGAAGRGQVARPRRDMAIIKDIVERRVNPTGVSEPVVTTQGSRPRRRRAPGRHRPGRVRQLVGQTGRLDFVPLGQTQAPGGPGPRPRRSSRRSSAATRSSRRRSARTRTGGLTVDFVLKDDGAKLFADYTPAHVGELLRDHARRLGRSRRRSSTSAIPSGQVQITAGGIGGFPAKEANNLVTILKFGSLPFPIQEVSSEQISATLGGAVPDQSLLAGALGIADGHHVHAHLLPRDRPDRELRARLLHARRRRRSSGSSR